nr:DUF892 family protein [Bacteroidota bacterium]
MQYSQLLKLFEDELKGIYWAEKVLAKTLIRLIKNATSAQLIDTLKINLEETIIHVIRLEDVFKSLDKTPVTKKCESLEVLIKETGEIIDSCEEGAMCDAAIISATQKIEHHEIAAYTTLCRFAETLDLEVAFTLLNTTLTEEKTADEQLSNLSIGTINLELAE